MKGDGQEEKTLERGMGKEIPGFQKEIRALQLESSLATRCRSEKFEPGFMVLAGSGLNNVAQRHGKHHIHHRTVDEFLAILILGLEEQRGELLELVEESQLQGFCSCKSLTWCCLSPRAPQCTTISILTNTNRQQFPVLKHTHARMITQTLTHKYTFL